MQLNEETTMARKVDKIIMRGATKMHFNDKIKKKKKMKKEKENGDKGERKKEDK